MYDKQVNVMEGPWEKSVFPNGEETTTREYRGNDYFDTSSSKRIAKLDG